MKKSSLFDKFIQRWRPASGVKVDTNPENRVTPAAHPPAEIQPEAAFGRKLTPKEEARLALGEGFQELSSLLRGMTVRLEDQGGRVAGLAHDVAALPAIGHAQLEAMRMLLAKFDRHLDAQSQQQEILVRSLGDLPQAFSGLQAALDRAAVTDERSAKTLEEFRSNMDRIQGSMAAIVDNTKSNADAQAREAGRNAEAVRSAVDGLQRTHVETSKKLETTHESGLKGLRTAHEDQANRLGKIAHDSMKWNRAVVVLLVIAIVVLGSIFGVLLYR